MKVWVLGGGLAGLSAAHQLTGDGVPVTVLEKEARVGGLARSYESGGFTHDLGPHRFHTQDPELLEHVRELLGGRLEERTRRSRIQLEGRFFDYPLRVKNAFLKMPPLTTAKIVVDYLTAKAGGIIHPSRDRNFEEWVVSRFGRKMYEIYFKVYTEKMWGLPCTELSADWAAQRITLLSLWDTLVKTVFRRENVPRTYVSRFYYPRTGGIGAIGEAYAERIVEGGGEIRLNTKVDDVGVEDGRVTYVGLNGGRVEVGEEDVVFSTIPLTDFVRAVKPKPPEGVVEAAEKLRFRSINLINMRFDRDRVSLDNWIYLPEPRFIANRLSESKNFSEANAPEGKTIVAAELTCRRGDEVWNAGGELGGSVVEEMASMGLVDEGEYMGCEAHGMEYAYPVYDIGYRENLKTILDYLNSMVNLRVFGRNGLFRYNNMDHSISMGLTAAKSLTDDSTDYMRVATEQEWFG